MQKSNDTIVTGYHAIRELAKKHNSTGVLLLAGSGPRIDELRRTVAPGVKIHDVSVSEIRKIGGREVRHAVLVLQDVPEPRELDLPSFLATNTAKDSLVVVLDGVTDPHNFGAILRTADQFAVDLVVTPERRSARETDTVARTSAGAVAHVPTVVVKNLPSALAELKKAGFWVYGADSNGRPVTSVDMSGRVVLVLGSEGAGLGRLVSERCDDVVSIPARGHADSFNVSVAAGILMFDIRRRQGFFDSV
ncbi:MAG: 23S rRNA (guanosine(2251)-2'-O)-methyltransferase RlmB [Spirochaetaceae bacterium]|nr:MAG: 23S rRNA (guanosine(2251)-2'-O)-methyltransferase RlmB [Spirochaetaceae bacterium]